jgi:hypothetical protein
MFFEFTKWQPFRRQMLAIVELEKLVQLTELPEVQRVLIEKIFPFQARVATVEECIGAMQ